MNDIEKLVEIEAIKQLKARYQRAVDTKDWELMRSVLAEDAVSVYSGGKHSYEGRENIVAFLSDPKGLGSTDVVSMHHAHTPEIEITSDTTATGTWYLEDFVISKLASDWAPNGTVLHGTGVYEDEYVKAGGQWQIARTGYQRIFEDLQPRAEGSLLRTRWNREYS